MEMPAGRLPESPPASGAKRAPPSVRAVLIFLVLACLVPGILGAIAFFVYEYEVNRTQLEKDTVQTARALMQAVDNQVLQIEALAQGLATSDSIQAGDLARFHARARRGLQQSRLGFSVALTNEAGQQVLNTHVEFGQPLPELGIPEVVRRVFATGRPAVSNVFMSNILHRPIIAVAVPVMIQDKVAYVLTVSERPERFNDLLKAQGLPDGWVGTVFDGVATIVARSRDAEQFVGHRPAENYFQKLILSDEGAFEAVMRDGVPVLSAHTRSSATNWRVAISIPQLSLAAALARRLSALALGIAALFGIGLVLSRFFSAKIVRSFRGLTGPAYALGAGETVVVPSLDIQEANEVALALQRASALLKERTATLEQTNRSLREKERELEEAHALARFGTWSWDIESGQVKSSVSSKDVFGRELPPFQAQRGTLLTVESWERVNEAAATVAETGGYDLELQGFHASGALLWIHAKCTAIREAGGKVVALRGTLQDITERKQAEERLKASEEKYRTLFTNMTEGFALGEPVFDDQGAPVDIRFLEVNEAFHEQTGIPRGIEGRPVREILPALEPFWIERYSAIARTGQAARFESYNADTQRHYEVYSFSPAANRFAILFRDVTEQRRTERALQENEAYLRQLIATLPGMVWTATPEGETDFVSERWTEYTGRDYESQLGLGFLEAIHPDDRERMAHHWRAAVQNQAAIRSEYRLRRHDGAYRWFDSQGTPIHDRDGKVVRWLGVVTDIDDLKRTQEALLDSELRYRSLFNNKTSAIAHHRVIVDEAGQPVDFRIEAINETYERMLGQRREDIEGRLGTEVFPGIREFPYDPIRCFGRIGLSGGEGTYEIYFAPHRQWLSAYVYGPKPGEYTAIFTDITAQKEAEAALRESEYRLNLALKVGGTAVWEMDVATMAIVSADDLLFTMLGYEPQAFRTAAEWTAIVDEGQREEIRQTIDELVQGKRENYWIELRFRAKDGSTRWVLSQALAAERDATGKALRLIGTNTDITERKLAEQRIREAALHDPLTGLPNRALVFEYGSHLLAGAARNHGQGALLFIDLDRFKPVNDLHGHEIGDRLLKEVAKRLSSCTRREDMVGRLGGDEFVVILPYLDSDRHRAGIVAQHVVDLISAPFRIDSLELSVSPSIGISFYPAHGTNVDALIHAADLAMYQAKQAGRANYQYYTRELDRRADATYSLEARLRHALRHGGLELHYQPVVDIRSGRLMGAEALVRLMDEGELVGPASFIPVAESTGLIGDLGEWVAAEACRQHDAWRREGMWVCIAINVSALQFRQRDFAERLGGILADSGVDPACLQLEVTESTVMESVDDAVRILNAIKALGVKIALDDFGTGYSSLSSLSHLPLDTLKVDQSFVRRIENDQASRAVTEAIIALGRSLNLEVIGEGIESELTLHYLRDHGCSHAQGYWFSRPLPAPEFAQWYRQKFAS